jgi:hypothetical protein
MDLLRLSPQMSYDGSLSMCGVHVRLVLTGLLMIVGCRSTPPVEDPVPKDTAPPAPIRVVAIGDVHGDAGAARSALHLAEVMDDKDQWIGGKTVVVQLGDQLDRGDDEQEILDLFEQLRTQAAAAGGNFYPLLGNHETMNVQLDLRYVTDGGFADFADTSYSEDDAMVMSYPESQRGRVAAFRPGGTYAKILAAHPMILQFEGTIFVHGGVLPAHLDTGIDAINEQTAAWMRGEGDEPQVLQASDSPVWSRHFSKDTDEEDCTLLDEVLSRTNAKRMVVAHTVQEGINAGCDDKVWRVDVGLAAYYGGTPEVLEIVDGKVSVLGPTAP